MMKQFGSRERSGYGAVIAALMIVFCLPSLALAQSTVLQGGPWTPGHVGVYGPGSSQPIIIDGGPAHGGGLGVGISELGITAQGVGVAPFVGQGTGPYGTNACMYDAPISNAAGYHFLCFSANATISGTNGGQIVYGAGGLASTLPLSLCVNGTCVPAGGSLSSLVVNSTSISGGTNGDILGIGTGANAGKLVDTGILASAPVFPSLGIGTTPEILMPGPTTPTAGSTQAIDIAWGSSAAQTACVNEASIWLSNVYSGWCLSKIFSNSFTGNVNSPATTLFVYSNNTGATPGVLSAIFDSIASVSSAKNQAVNIICRTASSVTGVGCNGLEIDVVPPSGVILGSGSEGLILNMFNTADPSSALVIGGINSGTWGNGIIVGGVASTGAAFAVKSGASMSVGLNLSVGTYASNDAILIGNGSAQGIHFLSTTGTDAQIFNDSSNNFAFVAGHNDLIKFWNNAFGAAEFTFDTASGVETAAGLVAIAAAPTVSSNQIGYGSTVAAATSCGSLSGAAGCIVVNIAGTAHYVPYY